MNDFFDRSFDPALADIPFYLEMLEEQQIDLSTLTVDDFFYVDEELAQRCEEVAEIDLIEEYEPTALKLLTDHPTSAHALLAIAGARCIDAVTLRAGLALRELADHFLEQQTEAPYDKETLIQLGAVGADILCEIMLLMDLESQLLETLTDMMQRVPACADYILFTALRNGAVFETNRYDGQTKNFFTMIRDLLATSEYHDPEDPRLIELADIVYTYMIDEEITDDLQKRIDMFFEDLLTERIVEEIDFYIASDVTLKPLLKRYQIRTHEGSLTSVADLFVPIVNNEVLSTPFYLDLLRTKGIDLNTLTVREFLFRTPELEAACDDLEADHTIAEYTQHGTVLLETYPTNAWVLLSIARAGAHEQISLRAALALRQLAETLLIREYETPLEESERILLGNLGYDVLFRYLHFTDLSDYIFPCLSKAIKLAPEFRFYYLCTALRETAIADITSDDDELGRFYPDMRETFIEVMPDEPMTHWHVFLADAVYHYTNDNSDDELVKDLIQQLKQQPFDDLQPMVLDHYLDAEPTLIHLFEQFHQPPTDPLPSNPAKDLHRLIERQNLSSIEEVTEFIDQFRTKPIPEVAYEDLTDDERAEDAVERAMQLPAPMRRARMHQLIDEHPNSLWPWVGLVETSESALDELDMAERGLAYANKINASSSSQQVISLMNARAHSLMFESRYPEAIEAFEEMLTIDETSVSKAGEPLLAMLIRRGQRQHLERAEQVITALQEIEPSLRPALPWLTLLYNIVRKRETSVINTSLAVAMQDRPFIADIIIGREPEPFADDDAALHTIILCRLCWPVYPEAVKMLKRMVSA